MSDTRWTHLADRQPGHVAVVGMRGIPASWGGVEKQCEELYRRMAEKGLDMVVYARSTYVPPSTTSHSGIRVRVLWSPRSKYLEAISHTALAIMDMALRVRPRIVHFYSQGPCLLMPLARLLMPGTKFVFTCGGLDWQRRKWPAWASVFLRLGEICSAYFSDRLVMVSKTLGKYYTERYGRESLVIPNGVTLPEGMSVALPDGLGLEPERYFVTISRLVPEKRVEDVIEAFIDSGLDRQGYKLAIVGDDASGDTYAQGLRTAFGGNPSVVFAGYCYGEVLKSLFANAVAFVSASELEGLPLTLLEAMSYGRLCLASDIPPHREVLGDEYRWIFRVGDRQALTGVMGEAASLDAAKRDGLGRACRDRVSRHFSWDKAAEELRIVYDELAADNAALAKAR